MRITIKDALNKMSPEDFQISSIMHCTLFSGDLIRNSTCSTVVSRSFADICSFRDLLQNKFPDEQFPTIVSQRNRSNSLANQRDDSQATLSPEQLFSQRHRLCMDFFDHVCLCHHVIFSKDLQLFLSASANSYRDHVSRAFTEGNLPSYKLFKEAKYANAKRSFLSACERYKADSDPHGAAISAMYAVEALAMQRYWSDAMEAAQFSLPIFQSSADVYGVVRALCHIGRAYLFSGDSNTAKSRYLDANSVATKYNTKDLRIVVCKHLAEFHHIMGDFQESIGLMTTEMLAFRSTTDVILHLDFKLYLSQLLLEYGAFQEAFELSHQITSQFIALPTDIQSGKNPGRHRIWIDDRLLSSAFVIQSKYHLVHRDIDSADAFAKKALSICRSDNSVGITCWVILGKCDLFKSACNDALKIFQDASRYPSFAFCETGLKAQVYKGLVLSEFLSGHQEKAVTSLALLRDAAMSSFYRLTHSQSLRTEAVILHHMGDFDSAQLCLEKCLSLLGSDFSHFSLRTEACKVKLLLSEVYRVTGNYGLSLKYLMEAKTILESNKHVDILLNCQVLRALGQLELLRSKVGEGIRLLEQALDLVQNTFFNFDTTMCLGMLAICHAMVGDFIRANERHKKMKTLASCISNSVCMDHATVVSSVVSCLQALSASADSSTSFTARAREDDRPLTIVIQSEQITIYDGLFSQKKKKDPVAIVSHRLDDSVMVAPSHGNRKGVIVQGRSSSPMFLFKAEDVNARFIILQLTSCLVSNNRPSPYLTTISFFEFDAISSTSASSGNPSDPSEISLIPRCMKGNVVPVRISHFDCQLVDASDGSIGGLAVLSSDPLESGSYPIRIRPSKKGKLHLHVDLIGHPVVGSPLEINITRSFPSPMRTSVSFFRTAIQNETNLFVFRLCDHSGSPITEMLNPGRSKMFQFRYVNRTAVALELSEIEVKHLEQLNNTLLVSAVFPHSGDIVLYVNFYDEGFAPTSISIRCVSESVMGFLSSASCDEANNLLSRTKVEHTFQEPYVSLLQSTECKLCFQMYLSFRKILVAFAHLSNGKLRFLVFKSYYNS
jgi:tetratricopeptide (TPR) repeat protein